MQTTMTILEFKTLAGGTIWTITFIKRTTGEVRVMNARFGVTKHLKGGSLKYDPAKKNLLGCFDVKGGTESEPGYKMINLETLINLKFRGYLWVWRVNDQVFERQNND